MAPTPFELRLGFLASHGGSNLQAILDAITSGDLAAQAQVVISNNSASKSLERATSQGIPALHISSQTHGENLDQFLAQTLLDHKVNLLVLAGYMKKTGPAVLKNFPNHILNIHPALLPKFGGQGMYGMKVHQAVIQAKENTSGATIHLVNAEYDKGPILAQRKVPVLPTDTPETLQIKVLEQEHLLYPETLKKIASGEIDLEAY